MSSASILICIGRRLATLAGAHRRTAKPPRSADKCAICNGTGLVDLSEPDIESFVKFDHIIAPSEIVPCPHCGGRGWKLRQKPRPRGGFTLIELLVVILIIAVVSAVALPVVLPALSHRQVSESARLLQRALAGARDAALHDGTPSGIRLLPDPAFPLIYLANGQIDPTQPSGCQPDHPHRGCAGLHGRYAVGGAAWLRRRHHEFDLALSRLSGVERRRLLSVCRQ